MRPSEAKAQFLGPYAWRTSKLVQLCASSRWFSRWYFKWSLLIKRRRHNNILSYLQIWCNVATFFAGVGILSGITLFWNTVAYLWLMLLIPCFVCFDDDRLEIYQKKLRSVALLLKWNSQLSIVLFSRFVWSNHLKTQWVFNCRHLFLNVLTDIN